MKVGLFFGSFNPIHNGHLIIANHIAQNSDLDRVWLVVTPHNPLKERRTLANDYDRLHLVQLAIEEAAHLEASNIEFALPKPSYTIDTLTYLREQHPNYEFVLLMGGDNLGSLHKWKNHDILLRDYHIYVYGRPNYDLGQYQDHPNVHLVKAPLMEISSSAIRAMLSRGQSIRYWVPDVVREELERSGLYQHGAV